MARYLLGLDGGGSKTTAIVVDESLTRLGEGHSGPSNFLRIGIEEATRNLGEAIGGAAGAAGVAIDEIAYAWCGIAGFDHPEHGRKLDDAVRTILPRGNYTLSTDAKIALTAGVGLGPGIIVIAGTGSVGYGRNAAGDEARAGGWGPILGDEGSGYTIVRYAMRAVMKDWDGRGPATRLTPLFCEELGIESPKDLPVIVYAPTTHSDKIASFMHIVSRAAEEGDDWALQIFETQGRELGLMVVAVARKLGMLDLEFPVACVGGAFHAGELLLDPIRRTTESHTPHARLQPPIESPVEAAARMAMLEAAKQ